MPDFSQYETYRVWDFDHWVLFLHKAQHFLGRCYLALKRDGPVDIFEDIELSEQEELLRAVAAIKKVMAGLFAPDKYDYGAYANDWPHCHLHIVPRYRGDREVEFAGHMFKDPCWGRSYKYYDPSLIFPDELLFELRDALRKALHDRLRPDLRPHPFD